MKTLIKQKEIWICCILFLSILQSCSKTESIPYEVLPENRITEFSISNSRQEVLHAAIDNEKNMISLYIPYYMGLDYITPTIKLDEGATLWDTEGNEINLDGGIEPIAIGDTAYFTVRSKDAIARNYTFIQKYLPFNKALTAGFTTSMIDTDVKSAFTSQYVNIYGNFASTSRNARFTFTDKNTGKVYQDFTKVISMAPSEAYYTMVTEILPEALAGNYSVQVDHQGRTTQLPDMEITYSLPYPTFIDERASYAIGDTITFTPTTFFAGMGGAGVYLELDRVYAVIKTGTVVPSTFPQSLLDTEIEFKVASQTRREVKIIVPENMPVGKYTNTNSNNMIFYFDYAEHTGFGKGIRTGVASNAFEVKSN